MPKFVRKCFTATFLYIKFKAFMSQYIVFLDANKRKNTAVACLNGIYFKEISYNDSLQNIKFSSV